MFSLLFFIFASVQASTYFFDSYSESRDDFLKRVEAFRAITPHMEAGQWKVPSKVDSELYTDWLHLASEKEKKSLVVFVTGVHGVESFAGTAVMRMAIDKILPKVSNRNNTGFLFIHAVNPYGHKYARRVTENNVDLNRSFFLESERDFEDPNTAYRKFESFLNPKTKVKRNIFQNLYFYMRSVKEILAHGIPTLRQAILQGQYTFPKGIYFGGVRNEPHLKPLASLLKKVSADYQRVFLIDLHTGFGARGELHYFGLTKYKPETKKLLDHVFKGFPIDSGSDEDFYETTGDLPAFIPKILPDKAVLPMTFEYGTLDSHTTKGSIESLKRTLLENQGHWWGYQDKKTEDYVKTQYREMFYPSDPKWRESIFSKTAHALPILIQRFQEFDDSN